jgi:hypothetical protein
VWAVQATLTGILALFLGSDNIAVAQAMGHGICAVMVSIGTSNFLSGRGVMVRDVWRWGAASQLGWE